MKAKPKEWRQLLTELASTPGWLVEHTNAGHFKVTPPEGRPMWFGATLSDHRGFANNRAKLKRAGWPPELALPAQPVPPCVPTHDPTPSQGETRMEETSTDDWGIYHPGKGETQLAAAIRYMRAYPDQGMTRQELCEMIGVSATNLGELAREARFTWGSGKPGVYLIRSDAPKQYTWLTTDFDRAIEPRQRKSPTYTKDEPEAPVVPLSESGDTITLRQVFANDDIRVYRDPDGELVRLVPVDFVFVDRT